MMTGRSTFSATGSPRWNMSRKSAICMSGIMALLEKHRAEQVTCCPGTPREVNAAELRRAGQLQRKTGDFRFLTCESRWRPCLPDGCAMTLVAACGDSCRLQHGRNLRANALAEKWTRWT